MIEIRNVNKSFKTKKVLNHISLNLNNQTYALLGPNGSGKTTLLRIITNIIQGEGEIVYKNKDDTIVSLKDIHIGYLPQKFGLFKEMKLIEQMNYFACLKDIDKDNRANEIQRVLEAVNMENELDKKCGDLSGGMIRRIGIAQAIMGNPDIILFDEPTTGLDPEERLRFKSVLSQLRGQCPIILSTHIVEDIESVCQSVLVLKNGEIIFNDNLENLKQEAKNKVVEIPLDECLNMSAKDYYQIRIFEKDNQKYTRILLLNDIHNIQREYCEETLEDGYMYLLKGLK